MNRAVARAVSLIAHGLAACTAAPPTGTQSGLPAPITAAQTVAAISEADLRQRLYAVADDSMGGRVTGSTGHIKVTQYLADELKRLGLKPAGDNGTYFQNVPFVKRTVADAAISVDGVNLTVWADYVPILPNAPLRSFDGVQVVYGGIAQDTTNMITREQAAGKFVVLLNRSRNPFSRGTVPGTRLETAAAVATVQQPAALGIFRQFLRTPGPTFAGGDKATAQRGLAMAISADAAAKLMGATVDSTLPIGASGKTVQGGITATDEPVTARNVVAILPGSDPKAKGQYVAIGAHSDHVPLRLPPVDHDSLRVFNAAMRAKRLAVGGRQLTPEERADIRVNVDSLRTLRPARLDSINNGADDDGSGTVAVLEIAEALAGAQPKPARSILFVWHVAEELGLFGAQYFTDHPTVPRDSIVVQLNNDMIGRGGVGEELAGGPDYVQLIGWRRLSNELGDVIESVNKQQPLPFKFDLQYDAAGHPEQYYCRSDHYEYARFGIPIAFFSTGNHGDYHQVTDEPQYVDYTKLKNVAQLVHDIGVRVANLDHRLIVDGPKPDPKENCVQ
jgi:hypothetical protein